MNANFKGVSVVLSDKAADDIWEKIGDIDEKDAEQDEKDIEQDEAIAGKLDKDDGMGLIDEKLGAIDRAIEDLEDELEGEITNVNTALTGRINTNQTNIGALQTALTNLTDKVNSIVNKAYSYREVPLWWGWFPTYDVPWPYAGDTLILSEPLSNFDYIDVYISTGIGSESVGYEEIRTFNVLDILGRTGSYGFVINFFRTEAVTSNGTPQIFLNSLHFDVTSSEGRSLFVSSDEAVTVDKDSSLNIRMYEVHGLYTHLTRIVGRKLTPLSQLIN